MIFRKEHVGRTPTVTARISVNLLSKGSLVTVALVALLVYCLTRQLYQDLGAIEIVSAINNTGVSTP